MNWLMVLGSILQLAFLILGNKYQNDTKEKARKEDLHAKLAEAIKNRDAVGVNDIFNQLR